MLYSFITFSDASTLRISVFKFSLRYNIFLGSCSSVKSNRTLDNDEESSDDGKNETGDEEDDEVTEVEDFLVEEKKADFEIQSEHYNSLVTHVMHQRAFTSNEVR